MKQALERQDGLADELRGDDGHVRHVVLLAVLEQLPAAAELEREENTAGRGESAPAGAPKQVSGTIFRIATT
eukprot:gene11606-biopygen336